METDELSKILRRPSLNHLSPPDFTDIREASERRRTHLRTRAGGALIATGLVVVAVFGWSDSAGPVEVAVTASSSASSSTTAAPGSTANSGSPTSTEPNVGASPAVAPTIAEPSASDDLAFDPSLFWSQPVSPLILVNGGVTNLPDALPSAEVPYFSSAAVGEVVGVVPGRSFRWDVGTNSATRVEVPFASDDAEASTVHVRLRIETAFVAPGSLQPTADELTIGLVVNPEIEVDDIARMLDSLGRVIVFLVEDSAVFDYDDEVAGVGFNGGLLGIVGEDGQIEFPALEIEDFVPAGYGLDQLLADHEANLDG